MYSVGIITVSDKGYKGERKDESGAVIEKVLREKSFNIVDKIIIPDEEEVIYSELLRMTDKLDLDVIFTTGGTGFSKRDVTPEATKKACDRMAYGISEAIRYYSLQITSKAMLSRAVSGIRKNTLIINLPGSPKAVKESLDFIMDSVKHGLDILLEKDSECAR